MSLWRASWGTSLTVIQMTSITDACDHQSIYTYHKNKKKKGRGICRATDTRALRHKRWEVYSRRRCIHIHILWIKQVVILRPWRDTRSAGLLNPWYTDAYKIWLSPVNRTCALLAEVSHFQGCVIISLGLIKQCDIHVFTARSVVFSCKSVWSCVLRLHKTLVTYSTCADAKPSVCTGQRCTWTVVLFWIICLFLTLLFLVLTLNRQHVTSEDLTESGESGSNIFYDRVCKIMGPTGSSLSDVKMFTYHFGNMVRIS